MVKGMEIFREYFQDYTDQYVLIGGAACDICNLRTPSDGFAEQNGRDAERAD